MTQEQCESINAERLAKWKRHLIQAHSTPAVLVGIGHDHAKGNLVVCTVEDFSNRELVSILRHALSMMTIAEEAHKNQGTRTER